MFVFFITNVKIPVFLVNNQSTLVAGSKTKGYFRHNFILQPSNLHGNLQFLVYNDAFGMILPPPQSKHY
jgi:hypothetical protein